MHRPSGYPVRPRSGRDRRRPGTGDADNGLAHGRAHSEAVIRFLHHDFGLSGRVFTLDATNWRTSLLNIARDPECRRAHRRINTMRPVPVAASEPASKMFEALPELAEPELFLPDAYITAMPCLRCGARVRIGKPEWALRARRNVRRARLTHRRLQPLLSPVRQ